MRPLTRCVPLVVLLAACGGGGGGGVSAAAWAGSLCSALGPLPQQAATLQAQLTSRSSRLADPAGLRDDLAEALGQVAGTFQAALDATERGGAPDVPDGENLQADVLASLEGAARVFADARDTVRGTAPTAKAVSDALVAASTGISSGFADFGDAFDALDDNEQLARAGKADRGCQQLESS